MFAFSLRHTGVSDLNLQNNAGYTAVMLASLTAPDGPGGMEVVRKIMELGNINVRSSQVTETQRLLLSDERFQNTSETKILGSTFEL